MENVYPGFVNLTQTQIWQDYQNNNDVKHYATQR